jgi:hypothetical protein
LRTNVLGPGSIHLRAEDACAMMHGAFVGTNVGAAETQTLLPVRTFCPSAIYRERDSLFRLFVTD